MRGCLTVSGVDNPSLRYLVCSLEHACSNETLLLQDGEVMAVAGFAYDAVAQMWVPQYCPKRTEADKRELIGFVEHIALREAEDIQRPDARPWMLALME